MMQKYIKKSFVAGLLFSCLMSAMELKTAIECYLSHPVIMQARKVLRNSESIDYLLPAIASDVRLVQALLISPEVEIPIRGTGIKQYYLYVIALLDKAIELNAYQTVDFLLSLHTDAIPAKRRTEFLHKAIDNCHQEIAFSLLKYGARNDIAVSGKTAVQLAEENEVACPGISEVVKIKK